MQQKASAEFDLQAKTLTITGELQPETPPLHDALVELLHGADQPEVQHTLVNNNNVLSYRVVFTESKGPSAQDLDITQLSKQLEEANSTIALLEDRLATAGKVAQMATDELAAIKEPLLQVPADMDGALNELDPLGIEPAPSNE